MRLIPIPKRMDVEKAAHDLHLRTLSKIPRPLDRLIYLASTRDYNTGLYYHDGLAARVKQEEGCGALAFCHGKAFRELTSSSLEDLVSQMEAYMTSIHTSRGEFIAAWRKLEPYRVAIPVNTDPLAAEFLFSNLKLALAILETRLSIGPMTDPRAWTRPSLVQ